jgi:hypothetical protein
MLGFSSFAETPYATLTSKAVSGTLAAALDDITVSATAKTVHNGTLAAALDDITVSATGVIQHTGELSATLEDILISAAGDDSHAGYIAVTLDDINVAFVGGIADSGDLTVILDSIDFSANGTDSPPNVFIQTKGGIKPKKKEYKNNSADVKKAIEAAVEAVTGEPKPKVKAALKVEEEPNTFVEEYEAILRIEAEKTALELAIAQMLEDERDDEEAILLLL